MVPNNHTEIYTDGQEKSSALPIFLGILIVSVITVLVLLFYPSEETTTAKPLAPISEKVSKEKSAKKPAFPATVPSSFDTESEYNEILSEEGADDFVVPTLDQSDELVREIAPGISSSPVFASWLVPDKLVRKLAVLADNVSRGQIPRKYLRPYKPKGKFKAQAVKGDARIIDPRSYRRYDVVTGIVSSLDAQATVDLYRKLRPLFQEAYEELGYPDQFFDETLLAAVNTILTAPVIHGAIRLSRPSVMFKFADRKLEKLNDVHKQMLRMGPKNTTKIQTKVREIRDILKAEVTVGRRSSVASGPFMANEE